MDSTYNKIWKSALNSLQRRSMSCVELRRKLKKKYPDEASRINQALEEMERLELLDDQRYTEQLVDHLVQRPIGRFKIILEAKKRGLESDTVEHILVNINYNEEKVCQRAFEMKDKILKESHPVKRKQKIMNFLRNRGFSDAVIYGVLK